MPLSFLYNEKNNILSISNRLLTFNNIRMILFDLPYVINNNIDVSTLTKRANTILEHQKDLLYIDHININISLDIINQNDNIYYDNFMLFLYDQNINLNFKNYPMYILLDKYMYLIHQMTKNINLDQFSFNKDLLTQIPKTIIDFLKIRKENTDTNIGLIDIYLKDIENVPESQNDLYNYIYILRKFPLFRIILNHYLSQNEPEIYNIISKNELDIEITPENEIFLPILFNFEDNEKILKNVNNLLKNEYYLNDFFYIIDLLEVDKETLINTYREMDYQEFGFLGDNFVNIETFIQKIYSIHQFDMYTMVSLYLKINYVDVTILEQVSVENFNILVSTYLVNLYVIFDYLNLNNYPIDQLSEIYTNVTEENYNYQNTMLTELLFYIHISYYIFTSKNNIYKIIDGNINLLKHFFYIIQYSKNILPDIFPLIIFLACSNKKIKFLFEYKNNHILEFLNEYYDIMFEDSKKIVYKK